MNTSMLVPKFTLSTRSGESKNKGALLDVENIIFSGLFSW
jgi:hypothetical protein